MATVSGQDDGAGDLFRALTPRYLFIIYYNSSLLHKVYSTFHQVGAWHTQIRSMVWFPGVNFRKLNFPPGV